MILSISGLARSGKDSVGKILIDKFGFTRVSMADSLKEICSIVFDLSLAHFHNDDLKDKKFDIPLTFTQHNAVVLARTFNELGYEKVSALTFQNYIGVNLETPRSILIFVGTDLGRNLVDTNVWLDIAINKIKDMEGHIVITDARFKNERQAIKKLGGITMFVDRPEITEKFNRATASVTETDQLDDSYNVYVTNDSTLSVLQSSILTWYNCRKTSL